MKGLIKIYNNISKNSISFNAIDSELQSFKDQNITNIEVRIHSNGGSMFEGFAIFNKLREFNVHTIIDGVAASIASVIALAGDKVSIHRNSYLFIHNPWNMSVGDTDQQFENSEDLKQFRNTLIDLYKSRTKLDENKLKEMTSKESFLSADKCLELGFVDEVIDNYPSSVINNIAALSTIFDDDGNIINKKVAVVEPNSEAPTVESLLDVIAKGFSHIENNLSNNVQTKVDETLFVKSLDERIKNGKMLPAMKDSLVLLVNHITKPKDNNDTTESLLSLIDSFLNSIPDLLLFSELKKYNEFISGNSDYDNMNVDESKLDQHNQALALSKKNNISYIEAIKEINK